MPPWSMKEIYITEWCEWWKALVHAIRPERIFHTDLHSLPGVWAVTWMLLNSWLLALHA